MQLYLDKKEMLRYWGVRGNANEQELKIAEQAGNFALKAADTKIIYEVFDCSINADCNITIGTVNVVSADLAKCLKGCNKAILLCATAGIEIDRLIQRYNGTNMALSTAISAAGSAIIETYLDIEQEKIRAKYGDENISITPRFSPGYGDLPLSMQTDFFGVLNITRRIGVTLNTSLLMTPTKSVTAIIGLRKD